METKERNMGEEKDIANEELLNKREFLSDETLKEVAGGGWEDDEPLRCNCASLDMTDSYCVEQCCSNRENSRRPF